MSWKRFWNTGFSYKGICLANAYMFWSLYDKWNDLKGRFLKYVFERKVCLINECFEKDNVLTNECFGK